MRPPKKCPVCGGKLLDFLSSSSVIRLNCSQNHYTYSQRDHGNYSELYRGNELSYRLSRHEVRYSGYIVANKVSSEIIGISWKSFEKKPTVEEIKNIMKRYEKTLSMI